jgi:hypothetical protein
MADLVVLGTEDDNDGRFDISRAVGMMMMMMM